MPCNSSYMEPTSKEAELQRTAKLIIYVYQKLNKLTPEWIVNQATDTYADDDRLVPFLCEAIKGLSFPQMDEIVYDGHNKTARDLADWWDKHQEADQEREKHEQYQLEKEKLVASALSKLTQAEKEALDL